MADLDFEMKLDRMFNEPPEFQDSATFAKLVELRLDRGWTIRQVALGAAGMVAGVIGVSQLIGSRDLLQTAAAATGRKADALGSDLGALFRAGELVTSLPMGGQVVWMGAALAAMAVAFAVFRAVEEFK